MAATCENDPNAAEFTFINGDERQALCSVCLRDVLFEIVTHNDTAHFRFRKMLGRPIIEVFDPSFADV